MFNITGTLKVKFAEQQVSERFRKRDFVITDNSSQYPQVISFQLVQDRCSLIDPFNAGDEIRVFFNLRGREWKSPQGDTRYFNTLEAWKIEGVSNSQNQGNPGAMNTPMTAPDVTSFSGGEGGDDLPF
ncbi:MAG TPA: DUF3127 domain-containing protein [Bacteroidia bacterium]|nr:DUF3127 domain-containing protein [Bacteroidia bacterium]